MQVAITMATLAAGPYVTQYGRRATCTLLAPAELGQPQNYGRPHGWDDATTPRTDRPPQFAIIRHRKGSPHPDARTDRQTFRGRVIAY